MGAREIIGLVVIIVALILTPVAWAFSRLLWVVAFVLFVIGGVLFFSERIMRRFEASENECGGGGKVARAMPTDIHNYTGWRSGGRSETMDSSGTPDVDD
jgi:hypothetical protein